MLSWGVIPSIRVRDMAAALDCYQRALGFTMTRGGPDEVNCSLERGDAHLMLERPTDFYSAGYNEAIRQRLGAPSATALYIEAADLDALYAQVQGAGLTVIDSLADRPWGQTEFTVEDVEGNWLTFWKSPPTSA